MVKRKETREERAEREAREHPGMVKDKYGVWHKKLTKQEREEKKVDVTKSEIEEARQKRAVAEGHIPATTEKGNTKGLDTAGPPPKPKKEPGPKNRGPREGHKPTEEELKTRRANQRFNSWYKQFLMSGLSPHDAEERARKEMANFRNFVVLIST